jgi:hypothetical protein
MGSRNAGGVSPRRFHCILLLLIGFLTNRVVLGDASVGFELLKADLTGLVFTNSVPPSRYLTNQIPLNGSGVALGDVDGDCDEECLKCGKIKDEDAEMAG